VLKEGANVAAGHTSSSCAAYRTGAGSTSKRRHGRIAEDGLPAGRDGRRRSIAATIRPRSQPSAAYLRMMKRRIEASARRNQRNRQEETMRRFMVHLVTEVEFEDGDEASDKAVQNYQKHLKETVQNAAQGLSRAPGSKVSRS
jgi:hypothetical protein